MELSTFRMGDPKTIHSTDVNGHLWLEVFLVYSCIMSILFLYRASYLPISIRRQLLLPLCCILLESTTNAIHSNRRARNIAFGLLSPNAFKSIQQLTSLTATVTIVGFLGGSLFKIVQNTNIRQIIGILLYLSAFVCFGLDVNRGKETWSVWFHLIVLMAMYVIAFLERRDHIIWKILGPTLAFGSMAVAIYAREFSRLPLLIGLPLDEKLLYFVDFAHFLHSLAIMSITKGILASHKPTSKSSKSEVKEPLKENSTDNKKIQ